MKDLVITEQLKGLDKSKAEQIEAVFAPMVEMLKSFENAYDKVTSLEITEDTCKQAKRLRLDIARVRIDADKVRKVQKEEYVRGGNAVQGVYNILKFAVVDKEEKLKEIETHFERLEAEKKKTLQAERELELNKYDVDGSITDLGSMDDSVWNNYLSGVKLNYQAVKDAEAKAEKERIERIEAERLEQERIRKENEKLKKEREESEKKRIALEKANAEKLRKETEAREKAEAEAEAKLEKERSEAEAKRQAIEKANQAKLKKEREERAKIEKAFAEKKAEEERILREEKIAEEKALQAGDTEKIQTLLSQFDLLRGGKLKSAKAQTAIKEAYTILSNVLKELNNNQSGGE